MMEPARNVTFPGEEAGFYSSGEGGMFVYAVVRAKNAFRGQECTVDAPLMIAEPNVCVTEAADYTSRKSSKTGFWIPQGEFGMKSDDLVAAVLLETTWCSLYSSGEGYFDATMDDLTPAGQAIVAALGTLGTVELFTFLDT